MSERKKVQLKDIAKEANVSVALVSYVLNGQHQNRIKKETAERIKAVAKRLNYRPNHFAKGLKTQKSHTIGLILADLANPFSAQLARIIEDELKKYNYNVLMGSTDEREDKLKDLVDVFTNQQVDGLIILPTENSEKEIVQLHEVDFPYVLIDRYFSDYPFNFVVNDNHSSTYLTTKQLIKNKRKKIGFITIETDLFHFVERKRGFVEACIEAGIDTENRIQEIRFGQLETGVAVGISRLKQVFPDLDALLFATDILTMYGLKYIIQHKLNITNDIEIMAVDEAKFYDIYSTPITYYKQPLEEMGQKAVRFLMSKIEGNNPDAIQEVLKGQLVIR